MNAAEVNTLCAPLLDRIGWPKLEWPDLPSMVLTLIDYEWQWRCEESGNLDFCVNQSASTAIRCHIMDWLARNGWDICLTGGAEDIRAAPPTNRMLAIVRLDKFPTPLHALVAVGMKATEVAHV